MAARSAVDPQALWRRQQRGLHWRRHQRTPRPRARRKPVPPAAQPASTISGAGLSETTKNKPCSAMGKFDRIRETVRQHAKALLMARQRRGAPLICLAPLRAGRLGTLAAVTERRGDQRIDADRIERGLHHVAPGGLADEAL